MPLKLDWPSGTVVRVTADPRSTLTEAWRTPPGDFVQFPYRPVLPTGDGPEPDASLRGISLGEYRHLGPNPVLV